MPSKKNKLVEHRLLFKANLARMIRRGVKKITRRQIKQRNSYVNGYTTDRKSWEALEFDSERVFTDMGPSPAGNLGQYLHVPISPPAMPEENLVYRVYSRIVPGDVILCLERWAVGRWFDDRQAGSIPGDAHVYYWTPELDANPPQSIGRWRAAMHMPSRLVRCRMPVEAVIAQRLGMLSEQEAIEEGLDEIAFGVWTDGMQDTRDPALWFDTLWRGLGSDSGDQWVWGYRWKDPVLGVQP